MKITIAAWEPEDAVATSYEFQNAVCERGLRPFIGWITFLSGQVAPALPRIDGALVEPFAGGHLIILPGANPMALDEQTVALARKVDDQLNRAGLLQSHLGKGDKGDG